MKHLKVFLFILILFAIAGCNKPKQFTVNFLVDGEIIQTEKVSEGESATKPEDPVKEGYDFVGWDKDFNNVTSDLDINALFEVAKHTVEFYVDGVCVDTQEVLHNGNATPPEVEEKEGYTFKRWDKEYNNVTSDLKIYAEFEINTYFVNFYVDGQYIDSVIVEYGGKAIAPEVEEKEGYTFVGWDQNIDCVKENLEANALFEPIKYTVTFMVDGAVYETQEVPYGGNATKPQDPTKDGFVFIEWDTDFNNVKSDLEINAHFEENDMFNKLNEVGLVLDDMFKDMGVLGETALELPTELNGIEIQWGSSNEEIIAPNGKITPIFTENKYEEVILSAKLILDNHAINRQYNLQVERKYKDLSKGINAAYNSGGTLSEIALNYYDIVYYSFLELNDAEGNLKNTKGVANAINVYKNKLHAKGGRALFSFVAQTANDIGNLLLIIKDDEKLDKLVNNLLTFCLENDLDGIDVDWETPRDSGAGTYLKLIKKIYETFKAANPRLLVTSAIAAGPWQYVQYGLKESAKYHDYINMMSYDLHTTAYASFQNALYFKTKVCPTQCAIDTSLKIYNDVGVKNEQIIIGVPFYGRVFINCDGVGINGTHNSSINQSRIMTLLSNGYKEYYDEDCQVPYLYSEKERTFVTFENARSINAKWKFIAENGLAGMMCWNYIQDYNNKLTMAMGNGKAVYGK